MTSFKFLCSNAVCGNYITAMVQQGGMTIKCGFCKEENEIPIISATDAGLINRKMENDTVGERIMDYGKKVVLEEMGIPGLASSNSKSQEKSKKETNKRSIVDRAYDAIGLYMDKYLNNNTSENTFKIKLKKIRDEYLKLSSYRKRHITFFISLLIVFLLVSLFSFSLLSGIAVSLVYASFIALNQIKLLNSLFSWITEIVVAFTVFFLPERLKDIISSFFKYFIFIIIVISFGKYVGPVYIGYKGFLVAMDKKEI